MKTLASSFTIGALFSTISLFTDVQAADDHRLWARQGPCTSLCANIRSAGTSCTNYDCLCPTVLISGAACSSCLVTVAMNTTEASQIGAVLSTCENPDACVSECSNIAMAAGMCGSNLSCFCPTVLVSGSGCLSCLQASHTNPTDAAFIASYMSTICLGKTASVNVSGMPSMTPTTGPTASVSSIPITTAVSTVGPTSTSGTAPHSSLAIASSGAGRLDVSMGNVLIIMFALATSLFIG